MNETNGGGYQGKKCACPHHKVVPIMILLLGVLFLISAFHWVSPRVVEITWPILVIIAGGTKLGGCKCCDKQ